MNKMEEEQSIKIHKEEQRYRKQLKTNKDLTEQQLKDEDTYYRQMKLTKPKKSMEEIRKTEDELKKIIESEQQYKHQLMELHGVSEDEVYHRIKERKEKDRIEYEEAMKKIPKSLGENQNGNL